MCSISPQTTDSRTPTPTPEDTGAKSAAAAAPASETSDILSDEEGRGFAKRIVAEILDRSVAKYRGSLEGDVKTERVGDDGGGDSAGPKSNYVNFDIAQTVIVSSREEADREQEEGEGPTVGEETTTANERDDSRTPTG